MSGCSRRNHWHIVLVETVSLVCVGYCPLKGLPAETERGNLRCSELVSSELARKWCARRHAWPLNMHTPSRKERALVTDGK